MARQLIILLVLLGSLLLLGIPAVASEEYAVVSKEDRYSCSADPPLLPSSCHPSHHQPEAGPLQDPNLKTDDVVVATAVVVVAATEMTSEQEYNSKEGALRLSAEEIKAQIRREAAARHQEYEEDLSDSWQHMLSAEDVKAQIRQEALLQAVGGLRDMYSTGDDDTGTTSRHSNSDSDVDFQGDTKFSSSTIEANISRQMDQILESKGTEEETSDSADIVSEDHSRTAEGSAMSGYVDLQDDEPAKNDMKAKMNTSDREALPVINRNAEDETALPPDAVPSSGAENGVPMIQSSVTSSNFYNNSTDDRTMLDIFGEQAKEFLTRRVIPETDRECRWDWRSVRCEPSCQCRFQPRRGDYHIGRSCRLIPNAFENCVPKRPWNDHEAARRFLSLAHQTAILVRSKTVRVVTEVLGQAKLHYERMQDRVCPQMPCHVKTLPEIMLCHRSCEHDDDDDATIPFAERRSLLMKLQNRFTMNPLKEPTEDTAWEF